MLTCLECQAPLPDVRRRAPWCECGWSSVADEELKFVRAQLRGRQAEQDLERAQQLAEMDARVLRMLASRRGRWLWKLYTYITVVLCVPVLLIWLLLWGGLLALFVYVLLNMPGYVTLIVLSLISVSLAYPKLVRPTKFKRAPRLTLTPQTSPQLFEIINQVAARLQVPPFRRVGLYLGAGASAGYGLAWRPVPHVERQLDLGLLAFNALTMTQFKALLAHEMAHLATGDALFGFLLNYAIRSLDNLFDTAYLLFVLGWPIQIISFLYRRLLVWVGLRAMRRHEYSADRAAALVFGRLAVFRGLIRLSAMGIEFSAHLSRIVERIQLGTDRHDFYYQFLRHWDTLRPERREELRARAVASLRSVHATHPTYQDRYRALEPIKEPSDLPQDRGPALPLLPNANELGRKLTIMTIRRWNKRGR